MNSINNHYEGLGESYSVKHLDKTYMKSISLKKLKCHQYVIDKFKRYVKKKSPFYDLDEYSKLKNILDELNTYETQELINQHNTQSKNEQIIFKNLTDMNIKKSIEDFDKFYNEILQEKQQNATDDRKEYKKNYMRDYMKVSKFEMCECGSEVNIYKKTQHLATKKHKTHLLNLNILEV